MKNVLTAALCLGLAVGFIPSDACAQQRVHPQTPARRGAVSRAARSVYLTLAAPVSRSAKLSLARQRRDRAQARVERTAEQVTVSEAQWRADEDAFGEHYRQLLDRRTEAQAVIDRQNAEFDRPSADAVRAARHTLRSTQEEYVDLTARLRGVREVHGLRTPLAALRAVQITFFGSATGQLLMLDPAVASGPLTFAFAGLSAALAVHGVTGMVQDLKTRIEVPVAGSPLPARIAHAQANAALQRAELEVKNAERTHRD